MNRRGFIQLSALGAVSGAVTVASTSVQASTSGMAGGVFHTKEAPGRWSKKAGGHLPIVEVMGKNVQVTTPHEMKGHEHYIVKHIVLNDKFEFIAEKMFDPKVDTAPISNFALGSYSGKINVLSVCNQHDTWMSVAEV